MSDAEFLLSGERYKSAVNRIYYAAFHAIRALLIWDEFDSKKHSGIISKFNELYIKTKKLDKQLSKIINILFAIRTVSDYDDSYEIEEDKLVFYLEEAKRLVSEIENHLLRNDYL